MSRSYLPRGEAPFLAFSAGFTARITAAPAEVGLTLDQALACRGLYEAFAAAYAVARRPLTRSPVHVQAKNQAKATLIASVRELVRIIQATPTVTDAQRTALGLAVRRPGVRRIPPPPRPPALFLVSAVGRTLTLRLADPENPIRRGKPAGAAGASLFRFIGTEPPQHLSDWTFVGNTGQTTVRVDFPAGVPPGAQVWTCAFWFSPSKQSGPMSAPLTAHLPGGVVSQAA